MRDVLTVCCYCGCGCGLYLRVENGRVIGSMPSRQHPVSKNNLCAKGWHAFEFIHHPDRLTQPLLRKKGRLRPVTWDEALDATAQALRQVKHTHGPDRIGLLASAKCTNEENYLLQKFARAAIGTNNIDHCARLCHAPSVAGLAMTFGSGAMTNSIAEIEQAQVILVSGSNTTETHPQIARRMYEAVDRGARLIVIDPRRTRLARHAHLHLQIRPGTDIPLLNGMMRCILDENLADDLFIEMRTENYLALRDMLYRVDITRCAAICGVDEEQLRLAARMYARSQRSVICYCLGVTQHVCGTDNVRSYANLALLTGHVEQEFTGVDPLRGQSNVQGACDMGSLPAVLPGYQAMADPVVRARFARAWGVELPEKPGLTVLDMTHPGNDQVAAGLKAMLIMGENPALSDPDLGHVRAALAKLEFLAVADIFLTETAQLADVVFPAATFAEKTGTITSSERRVQLLRQAIEPVGSAWQDHRIIMELSRRLGYPMDYDSPAEIMEEICLLTPIYGGMYHDRLDNAEGLQWPCPDREHGSTQYLHKYSFTRGRGRFEPAGHTPPAEAADAEFPYILVTGRVYHHYHTGTMTRRSRLHSREYSRPLIEVHPADAKNLGLREGFQVRVSSRRGECAFTVQITDRVTPGHLFTTFHFAESPVNILTSAASDPVARCPEYKVCAVCIERTGP